jgi:hypothetical protein
VSRRLPVASAGWRHDQVLADDVWGKVVHRVLPKAPEQVVDEVVARIKQILSG